MTKRDLLTMAAGIALGAAGYYASTQVQPTEVPNVAIAGDVAEMARTSGHFESYPIDGRNWFKRSFVESEADTMVMAYFPAKYTLGLEDVLRDHEARRVLSCNFTPCVYTPVNGVQDTVRSVSPVPFRSDVLRVDVRGHETKMVYRSRWGKVLGGVQ